MAAETIAQPQQADLPSRPKEAPAQEPPFTPPPLPSPFTHSTPAPTLLAHGAEGLLYKTTFLTPAQPCILKHRPRKSWRHPSLDARLTKHRILVEARILVRARRERVPVPAVLALDAEAGWMCTEFIPSVYGLEGRGLTVREALERWKAKFWNQAERREEVRGLLRRVGEVVAGLHRAGLVHGDLTSSNLMLRSSVDDDDQQAGSMSAGADAAAEESSGEISLSGQVVLIDFGLASTTTQDEDRAVDLYVLERAMGSTHPWLEDEFGRMIDGYAGGYKGANIALKRLEDVRMRGRKRSMIG